MFKLFILSILFHIIDDFVFQPICLSKLKQKSFWIFVPGLKIDKRREQKQLLRK